MRRLLEPRCRPSTAQRLIPGAVLLTDGIVTGVFWGRFSTHCRTAPRKVKGGGDFTTGDIDPGSSSELTVNLDPGPRPALFGVICTIPGHAAQGMEGTLMVKALAPPHRATAGGEPRPDLAPQWEAADGIRTHDLLHGKQTL
jgi:hypothetical protein